MLIPFFFVTTGVRFDLDALLASPAALALLAVGLASFLLVRGLPVGWAFRATLPRRQLAGLGLYASTTLPLVVVVGDRAAGNGLLRTAINISDDGTVRRRRSGAASA